MNHAGITTGCATCHDTGKSFFGVTNLKTKPANHIPTTAACETCHAAGKFTSFAGTQMNHARDHRPAARPATRPGRASSG